MDYHIYLVDAFTSEAFKGNPAGVVPDARRLNADQMQKIARELNASETAFITASDRDSYRIRYFSPNEEVDFCGHSTLATFYILALRGYIIPIESGIKTVYIHSNNKKLEVDIYFFNYEIENIVVKIGTPEALGPIEDQEAILEDLNLNLQDINIDDRLQGIQLLKLDSKHAFIPVNSKEKLDSININSVRLKERLEKQEIQGIHLFFLPEDEPGIVYTRNFSTRRYLKEEPATGTANGSLIYLLKKNDMLKDDKITAIQGQAMGRESRIFCSIRQAGEDYVVEVGGKGMVVLEGIINVK